MPGGCLGGGGSRPAGCQGADVQPVCGAVGAAGVERVLDGTIYDVLHDRGVQRRLAAATKLYVGTLELRGPLGPFPADGALAEWVERGATYAASLPAK